MIKVGVLRGGPSNESPISLKTGENVLAGLACFPEKYSGYDILLGKNDEWYFGGSPAYPEKIFRSIDIIFNALHGQFGEDGKIQRILETFGIPYTGSQALSSSLGMNKILSRQIFTQSGFKTPHCIIIEKNAPLEKSAKNIFRTIGPSLVVKPSALGSSIGISITHDFNDLIRAVANAFLYSENVLVEIYIKGREATCGVIENFREQEHYALPVLEIIPPETSDFFDYAAKYSGETKEICPANFDAGIKKEIEDMAIKAHQALGCRHYSRADFIVSSRGVYILEVNTLPGLTSESLIPKAISAVGSSYSEFLDHLITLALEKK